MKALRSLSLWVCIVCLAGLVTHRALTLPVPYTDVRVATWDALGYYMYLPGTFIYHDLKDLAWYPHIDSSYHPTGSFYQAGRFKNGNYVFKYLSGTAITYSPFFFVANYAAPRLGYPADGFSFPYQLAIIIASLLYSFLGLLVLRRVLLLYFDEKVTSLTLLLVVFATNYSEYAARDSGMTHSYLFALYCFQLYVTIRWYQTPRFGWAFASGLLIGLAAITRPTDGVMLFIPLLWNEADRGAMQSKWLFVRAHLPHVFVAGLGLFIGVLPQLIYWKYVTGNWVYDVGSKWFFLNPYWRVLIGWTNGWLIYTPIAVFFIIGMFMMRGRPFQKSVITLFIINTWIIIAWSDWRYGATYSCRALVQSYPVLALAFASAVAWCLSSRWRYIFIALWGYLLAVNIFQLYQYDTGIIHYRNMNRQYYRAIYLNPHPSPLDMSLLDTDEMLRDEKEFDGKTIFSLSDTLLQFAPGRHLLSSVDLAPYTENGGKEYWIRVDMEAVTTTGLWESDLLSEFTPGDTVAKTSFNLSNALNKENKKTGASFYREVKNENIKSKFNLYLNNSTFHCSKVKYMKISLLSRPVQ